MLGAVMQSDVINQDAIRRNQAPVLGAVMAEYIDMMF